MNWCVFTSLAPVYTQGNARTSDGESNGNISREHHTNDTTHTHTTSVSIPHMDAVLWNVQLRNYIFVQSARAKRARHVMCVMRRAMRGVWSRAGNVILERCLIATCAYIYGSLFCNDIDLKFQMVWRRDKPSAPWNDTAPYRAHLPRSSLCGYRCAYICARPSILGGIIQTWCALTLIYSSSVYTRKLRVRAIGWCMFDGRNFRMSMLGRAHCECTDQSDRYYMCRDTDRGAWTAVLEIN